MMNKTVASAILGMTLCVSPVSGAFAGTKSNDGHSRELIVFNVGDVQIIAFHGASVKTNSWGPDLMPGIGQIRPGKARKFDLDDEDGSCTYNLQALFADGNAQEMRGGNICEAIAAGSESVVSGHE